MFDLLQQACELATRQGCQFADARYLDIQKQRVMSRDHSLSGCNDSEDRGFGVRVLYQGAWGFACSPNYRAEEVSRVVTLALRIARASARAPRAGGVHWAAEAPLELSFHSHCVNDPFTVSLEEKADLLVSANEIMLLNRSVKRAQGYLLFKRVRRWYVNSEGSQLHSDVT